MPPYSGNRDIPRYYDVIPTPEEVVNLSQEGGKVHEMHVFEEDK